MVAPTRGDSDLLVLSLLLLVLGDDDDPMFAEMLWRRLRGRFRQTEQWEPELDELFERFVHGRRYPRRLAQMREIATSAVEGFRHSFQESVTQRIDQAHSRIDSLEENAKAVDEMLQLHSEELLSVTREIQSQLWLSSCGVDMSQVHQPRFVPVRIYVTDPLPNPESLQRIIRSIESLVAELGFQKADEFPEESGSWWKRLVIKLQGFFTHEEVRDRLEKAERAIEIACLDKPQAEANRQQAEAASCLINALKDTNQACIQVGSLLLVKAPDANGLTTVVSRTLTPLELKRIEENQSALKRPEEILEWLQGQNCRRLENAQPSAPGDAPQAGVRPPAPRP